MSTLIIHSIRDRLKLYSEMVMFSHTLFSLPFALSAMLIAAGGLPEGETILWTILAFTGARNGANALNRIVDRHIDGKNPRTKNRHLPSGHISLLESLFFTGFCFLLLVVSAYMLNELCLLLLPIPIFLFILYSYSKRFTWLCHSILGIACGGASFGGWIAVTGSIELNAFFLAAANALWVCGFDIIYACQDRDFDMKSGLYSIPVRFGIPGALKISALCHLVVIPLLILIGYLEHLAWWYYFGVALIGGLLFLEHLMISPESFRYIRFASYGVNQIVGMVFFLGVIAGVFA